MPILSLHHCLNELNHRMHLAFPVHIRGPARARSHYGVPYETFSFMALYERRVMECEDGLRTLWGQLGPAFLAAVDGWVEQNNPEANPVLVWRIMPSIEEHLQMGEDALRFSLRFRAHVAVNVIAPGRDNDEFHPDVSGTFSSEDVHPSPPPPPMADTNHNAPLLSGASSAVPEWSTEGNRRPSLTRDEAAAIMERVRRVEARQQEVEGRRALERVRRASSGPAGPFSGELRGDDSSPLPAVGSGVIGRTAIDTARNARLRLQPAAPTPADVEREDL